MRRKRRVEVHIEHREISIFTGGSAAAGRTADFYRAGLPTSDTTGVLQGGHAACPTCGSRDLVMLTEAVADKRLDLSALNQGMQDGSIHFHRSPSGEWWICTKSLHQS